MMSLSTLCIDRYLGLVADATVRKLTESVPRDAQTGTTRTGQEFPCVSKAAAALDPYDVSASRRNILQFLDGIWIDGPGNLSSQFWREYRCSISELIHVSMVLESLELRSFGVPTVTIYDIPQSLVIIGNFVGMFGRESVPLEGCGREGLKRQRLRGPARNWTPARRWKIVVERYTRKNISKNK